MTPDTWTIIGTGIAVVVVNVMLFAWLRADLRDMRVRIDRLEVEFRERMAEVRERMAEVRERMAKLEGLLEGLREAVAGRRAA